MDIKKLGCEVLVTELNPYVESETINGREKAVSCIHAQAPSSMTACSTGFNKVLLFLFHIILQNIADAKHLSDLHINTPQFSKDHKSD
jgi:hypothetical protein